MDAILIFELSKERGNEERRQILFVDECGVESNLINTYPNWGTINRSACKAESTGNVGVKHHAVKFPRKVEL